MWFFICIFLSFFCYGCSFNSTFSSEVTIDINLPSTTTLESISKIDENGNLVYINKNDLTVIDGVYKLKINIDKQCPIPIIVETLSNTEIKQDLLGCILVDNKDTVEVTKAGGFTATLLMRLLLMTDKTIYTFNEVQTFCKSINWKRIQEKVESYSNPWEIDSDLLLLSIASGILNNHSFKTSLQ